MSKQKEQAAYEAGIEYAAYLESQTPPHLHEALGLLTQAINAAAEGTEKVGMTGVDAMGSITYLAPLLISWVLAATETDMNLNGEELLDPTPLAVGMVAHGVRIYEIYRIRGFQPDEQEKQWIEEAKKAGPGRQH